MKRIRKTITVLISALVIALMAILPAGCGEDDPNPSGDGDVTYTVTLLRSGGDAFDNTLIMATGPISKFGRTNSEGVWTFTGPKGKYDLEFDVPDGFQRTGTIDDANKSKSFTLKGALISTPASATTVYALGDCMHDFSVTDTTGKTHKLSEIFRTKKAVMLNFFFTNCGPCVSEFPGLQKVYEEYKDDIEVIAFSDRDDANTVEAFRTNATNSAAYGWDELTFPMVDASHTASTGLLTAFGIAAFPYSIMIDREGVICFIIGGGGSEEEFRAEFERYTADDYVQFIHFPNKNAQEKPNIAAPSSAAISNAINADGFTATYYHDTNEYNWPWIISADGKTIQASNSKTDTNARVSTFSMLYADFEIAADKVLAFDYKTSTEENGDYLYVFVDNELLYSYSGVAQNFSTCYAYVPLKAGKHTLALSYLKDGDKYAGDDTVYIKNMRFEDSVGARTEMLYRCATGGLNDNGDYSEYITPVYNEATGYYHVNTAYGPIIIADVLNSGVKWDERSAWDFASNDSQTEAYAETLAPYVTISNNARRQGFVGVTQELKESLDVLMSKYGNKTNNKNEWLDICYYYVVYGGAENEIVTDPAEGLAAHNSFPAEITAFGAKDLVLNHVNKERVLMPRGIWYKFVPQNTAIYRIRSVDEVDGYCWLRDENGNIIRENNSDQSYGFLIMEKLEKDKVYYAAVDFNDVDYTGEFDFVIEELDASGPIWTSAAGGGYTWDEDENGNMNIRLTHAVDYVLGNDNCYHVKNADGSAGALLYVDLINTTDLFYPLSIEKILVSYNYNEDGSDYYNGGYYCKNCGNKYPASIKAFEAEKEVRCYCGNTNKSRFEIKKSFELPTTVLTDPKGNPMLFALQYPSGNENEYLIQYTPMYALDGYTGSITSDAQYMTLLQQYGIKFTDYTATVQSYVDQAKVAANCAQNADEVGGKEGGVYEGFIPASKELIDILQKFITFGDYAGSPNITNAWLMMASYFNTVA
ncbi:MAG: TlpA family protein disulfide reductase [Clostridiales bacterium]|nr:TlpA family protein disulfide reductase [Clostridiales bacterium]